MRTRDVQVREIIADQAGEWFVAHRAGSLSAAERREFEAWLRASPIHVEEYLGVAFASGPEHASVGVLICAQMMLIYWPQLDYARAVPGAEFTLREGGSIVAHGRITKRWTEAWDPAG